ncbi:MAG: VanZ like family protein [Ilumatobacteraceae bacterium]|nr:VanZ like family protein [Ilumatobacteraceae bacterium]
MMKLVNAVTILRVRRVTLALLLAVGVAYAVAVLNLTVWSAGGDGGRNYVPFRSIWDYLSADRPARIRVRHLGGNAVLLMPLGILLGLATSWRLTRSLAAIVAVAISIETWQLLGTTGRTVDIDDVILNSIGGGLGVLLGLGLLSGLAALAPSTVRPRRSDTASADD